MPTVHFDLRCIKTLPQINVSNNNVSINLSRCCCCHIAFIHLQGFVYKRSFIFVFLVFGCQGCPYCSSSAATDEPLCCHIIMKPQIVYRATLVCLLFGSYGNVFPYLCSAAKTFFPPYLPNYLTFRAKRACFCVCLRDYFLQSSNCPLLCKNTDCKLHFSHYLTVLRLFGSVN